MEMALGFELVDRHVVAGRADDIACTDASGSLTFARLLERSAALAGGFRVLGIGPGDAVHVDLPVGNDRVVVACAVIRLLALPASSGAAVIRSVDGVATVFVDDDDVELTLVERTGRSDPHPAPKADPAGYVEAVTEVFGDIVGPLLSGSPVV
jgi:acyl-coenzyme A synthetase/AMP-(fatty) acid ligase